MADGTNYKVCTADCNLGHVMCTQDSDCSVAGAGSCTQYWCSVTKDQLCEQDTDCPNGETCSAYTDGSGAYAYPPRDGIGRGTNQESFPVYNWSNIFNGGACTSAVLHNIGGSPDYSDEHIQMGRDFFDNASYAYSPYPCPHPASGLTGTCDPAQSGTSGYAATNAVRPAAPIGLTVR